MRLLKWLTRRFKQKPRPFMRIPIESGQVMADDLFVREVAARAFNASPDHYIVGHVDKSGELQIEEKSIDSPEAQLDER